jgi:ribosomal-protein-alanine N-acetyltransferase
MELNKDIFLTGETIYLRILNEKDVEGNYARWFNDPEITLYNSHGRFPMTAEKLKDFVKVSICLQYSIGVGCLRQTE